MNLLQFHLSLVAENYSKDAPLQLTYAVGHCRIVDYITKNRATMTYNDYTRVCSGYFNANEELFNKYKEQKHAY